MVDDLRPPFRQQFDLARDPYSARNALGITSTGGGGGGGGAPTDAQYIVAADDPTLTNDRVLTNTATVTWDFTTPGQAKANASTGGGGGGNVSSSGTPVLGQYARWVTSTTIQGVSPATVLSDIGAQPAGSYLTTAAAAATYQPLDADLTAIAALTGTNTIYYRSAANVWSGVTVSTGLLFTGGTLTATAVGLSDGDKGDITVAGSGATWTIDNDAVSFAKMQNVSAASRLIGRGSAAGAGDPEEITLGTNLTMAGTTLNAAGGGGAATAGNRVLIQSQTVGAAVASVAFTTGINATYDQYEFEIYNLRPDTSSTSFTLRVSTDGGSTYKSGGTDYYYNYLYYKSAAAGGNFDDSRLYLHDGVASNAASAANQTYIRFAQPSSSTKDKMFEIISILRTIGGAWPTSMKQSFAGFYQAGTTAINAIQFTYTAGNIASGTFNLYGIVK